MRYSEYSGKRVVVTGASSGIGEGVTQALVALGAEVHACSRRAPRPDVAAHHALDLTDPESITAVADRIGGQIDVLINCAGAVPMLPGHDILAVNFLGTRLLTERLRPRMVDGSSIVNVSSDGGYGWRHRRSLLLEFLAKDDFHEALNWYQAHEAEAGHAYGFSKEALNLWMMQQSALLIRDGIRINTASPGAVQTPMLEAIEQVFPGELIAVTEAPSGRRSSVVEQVGPILFLGSDAASYVNGADLAVDGGYWATLNVAGTLWGGTAR